MRILITGTMVILLAIPGFSQNIVCNSSDSIKLKDLRNENVTINLHYSPTVNLDSVAKIVCGSLVQKDIDQLLALLSDTATALVAHIILVNNFKLKRDALIVKYFYSGDKIQSTEFRYHELIWEKEKSGKVLIDTQSLHKIQKYWRNMDLLRFPILHNCDK